MKGESYMAIRINNIPITSARLFREHFSLDNMFPLLHLIVGQEGSCLFSSEDDLMVLEQLRASCENGFQIPPEYADGNIIKLQAMLLCRLGHATISDKEMDAFAAENGERKKTSPLSANNITLQNDETIELPLFALAGTIKELIHTVSLKNISVLPGAAHLKVTNEEGQVIDDVRLAAGTTIFANCLGGKLIELLPQISASRDHCNYFDFTNDGYPILCRKMLVSDEPVFCYNLKHTEGMTQFCADDEGGLLGVCDGKLLAMTRMFNPMNELMIPLSNDELLVKVVVKGRMLLALTNKGRTFSNISRMELENVVSIGASDDYMLYAQTVAGNLVFEKNPSHPIPVDNIYAVRSSNADTLSIKTRDGCNWLAEGRKSNLIGKHLVSGKRDFYMIPETGELFSNDSNVPIARHISDFVLAKSGTRNNLKNLIVYDGFIIKRINI